MTRHATIVFRLSMLYTPACTDDMRGLMNNPPDQFKKAPKRVTAKGKRVIMSPEAKAAYEAKIREMDEREKLARHLPPDMRRGV